MSIKAKDINALDKQVYKLKQDVNNLNKEVQNKKKLINTINQLQSAFDVGPKNSLHKKWNYVPEPTESERYPLVKYDSSQLILKKLNIIK